MFDTVFAVLWSNERACDKLLSRDVDRRDLIDDSASVFGFTRSLVEAIAV